MSRNRRVQNVMSTLLCFTACTNWLNRPQTTTRSSEFPTTLPFLTVCPLRKFRRAPRNTNNEIETRTCNAIKMCENDQTGRESTAHKHKLPVAEIKVPTVAIQLFVWCVDSLSVPLYQLSIYFPSLYVFGSRALLCLSRRFFSRCSIAPMS